MRISDGSSDVCSSDLRFLNPGGIVHGGWVMTVLDSAMGLAAVTMLEEGGFAPTHETSVKFLKPIHADIGPLRVIGTVIRSEEHTSELQSLMRISYAVFCLKKTTHTQILNEHTYETQFHNIPH